MTILKAILLGVVQGITEWLPVSSSGHLVILQEFLGISQPLFFDILLHVSTLIVIFIVFWRDINRIFKDLVRWNLKSESGKILKFIIIGSIPTAALAIFFHKFFVFAFSNLKAVSIGLIFTSLLLFLSQRTWKQRKVNFFQAILVGIAQGLALVPGVSRSGATISTGLICGMERKKVAKYSFLLVIPAIIGATIFEFDKVVLGENFVSYLFGMIAALVVGYFSLKFLLKIIEKGKFYIFGYYCLVLGCLLLIFCLV